VIGFAAMADRHNFDGTSRLEKLDLVDYHRDPFGGHDEELLVLLKIHPNLWDICSHPNLWDIGNKSSLVSQNIQLQGLVDLNRCGRYLLDDKEGSVPLSLWPKVLELTNEALDGEVERSASALYHFLRNGPALATRGENW
jgi:hypothetical protein